MDWLSLLIALVIAAAVLFLLEILTPIFGIFAGLGLLAAAGSIVVGFVIGQWVGVAVLAATLVWIPLYLVVVVKVLPKTPLGKRLFLGRTRGQEGGGSIPSSEALRELVGQEGVADTFLRPSGSVRVAGRRVNAVSEQGTISRGTPIRVVRASSTEVVVRAVGEGVRG